MSAQRAIDPFAAGGEGAPTLPPGRTVVLGEGTTFVRDAPGPRGAPTVLLLHGLGATADLNWFTSYGALAERFRVVAMDLRGHGRGIRTRRPFSLEDCADDASAVCEALDLDPVIVVGYSMGGPVAQLLWHRHPERVAGMVLCATSRNFAGTPQERFFFSFLGPAVAAVRAVPPSLLRAAAARAYSSRVPASPLRAWALSELRLQDPHTVVEGTRAIGSFSSREWIGGVDVPASVVVTLLDQLVSARRQLKLAAAIPGATVHTIPCDHTAPAQPEVFVPALVRACNDVAERLRV